MRLSRSVFGIQYEATHTHGKDALSAGHGNGRFWPGVVSCNPERPDSEIVKLVVQKSEAYADKSDDEIKEELPAFARGKLSPYKVPKIIEFVDAIPLTLMGQVNIKRMR